MESVFGRSSSSRTKTTKDILSSKELIPIQNTKGRHASKHPLLTFRSFSVEQTLGRWILRAVLYILKAFSPTTPTTLATPIPQIRRQYLRRRFSGTPTPFCLGIELQGSVDVWENRLPSMQIQFWSDGCWMHPTCSVLTTERIISLNIRTERSGQLTISNSCLLSNKLKTAFAFYLGVTKKNATSCGAVRKLGCVAWLKSVDKDILKRVAWRKTYFRGDRDSWTRQIKQTCSDSKTDIIFNISMIQTLQDKNSQINESWSFSSAFEKVLFCKQLTHDANFRPTFAFENPESVQTISLPDVFGRPEPLSTHTEVHGEFGVTRSARAIDMRMKRVANFASMLFILGLQY